MLPKVALFCSLVAVAMGAATYPPRTYPPRQAASCGNFPGFMTGDRIVGGEAAPTPIPWQVSVRQGQSGWGHFCGGTILDAKTVMCAAHCFTKDQSMSGYYIAAGMTDRKDNNAQKIEIANGVWNAQMPYVGNNNDFIILKLKSALTFNDKVGAACLPEPSHAPDATGQTCFVSGWGTLESGASGLPDDLQWVAVPTVTNAQCNQAYNGITSSMICAGLPTGGKDSCQGDSGGPFICRNDNGKAVLTGVVSFGIGCALADYPGVYARTTAVLDWVKDNMEGGNGSPPPPPPGPTTQGPTNGPTEAPGNCNAAWIADNYCDDINNTEECEYDGGDCCQENPAEGWDTYCNACECLDAPEPTTVGPVNNGTCNAGWIADNYCDDINNNPECEFDGGDCCQEDPAEGWNNYCEECECLDAPEPTTEAPMECAIPQWAGDSFCDDENNNPECGFDGGDCCDNTGDSWDNYCSLCECLEMPETTEPPMETTEEPWYTTEDPMETTEEPMGDCATPQWFGDNYCDDENNTPECGFDGGDCCDNEMEGYTNYCNACECLEYPEPTEEPGTNCAAPHWFGDAFCDDENNTEECGFDGGDCCNNEGQGWDNYCSDCECLA